MQPIASFQVLVGIEVKPALASLIFRPAVPGDADRLQPAARHRNQILLQWIDAERIRDRIVVQRAVRTVGAGHELVAVAKESGRDPEMVELGAGKIAEHRRSCGRLHRQRVVRALPSIKFRRVAASAGPAAHKAGRLLCLCCDAAHKRQHNHYG